MEKLPTTISSGMLKIYLFLILMMAGFIYIYLKFYRRSKKFMDLAKQIPGPKPYPLIGTVYLYGFTPTDIYHAFYKYSRCFGPVSSHWMGPEFCTLITKATDMEVILSSKDIIEKPRIYKCVTPLLGLGLVTESGERWKKHRKILSPTFHFKILEDYIDVFNVKCRLLVKKLEEKVDNMHFNIEPYFNTSTFDMLCESAMSTDINANILKKYASYAQAQTTINQCCMSRIFRPWLHPELFFKLSTIGKKSIRAVQIVEDCITQVIARKREIEKKTKGGAEVKTESDEIYGSKKFAFLDHLLKFKEDEKNQLNDEDIMDEVKTFMSAGTETLNAALGYMSYELSRNFDIQEKIVEEIKEVFGSLEDKPFTYSDLQSLKYLERVVKEVLRLYPSIPIVARKVPEDLKIPSGYTLPRGSTVVMNFHTLHRDPEVFPNPEEFNPDNFLPERMANRHPYAYCPFSAGPRNCIGQKYATLQLKSVMLCLMRNYWFLPTKFDLGFSLQITMRAKAGIYVGLMKRTEERPVIQSA